MLYAAFELCTSTINPWFKIKILQVPTGCPLAAHRLPVLHGEALEP